MGYSTDFFGELLFKEGTMKTEEELILMETILGSDARDMPAWKKFGSGQLTHMDLAYNKFRTGIEWSGDEKTYDLPEKVALLIKIMRSVNPNFGLFGKMKAKGERDDDRWSFEVSNGTVIVFGDDGHEIETICRDFIENKN